MPLSRSGHIYLDAGVDHYAVWAHESEGAAIAELVRRQLKVDLRTRAMAMSLDGLEVPRPEIEPGSANWNEHLRYLHAVGVPQGLLAGVDGDAFHVLVARVDGEIVATAIAYDDRGDCGIYNMGTLPHARRRGFGGALTALHLHHARDRGCVTASLQATEMADSGHAAVELVIRDAGALDVAQRVYAAAGFRSLGRFIEYVPRGSAAREPTRIA